MTFFFLNEFIHFFVAFLGIDHIYIKKQSLLLSVLDECKCFLEINLIKKSSSLIETLLKPNTPSLDDNMPLVINFIIALSNFL